MFFTNLITPICKPYPSRFDVFIFINVSECQCLLIGRLQFRVSFVKEWQTLVKEQQTLVKEGDSFVKEWQTLVKEGDSFVKEQQTLVEEGDSFVKEWQDLVKEE